MQKLLDPAHSTACSIVYRLKPRSPDFGTYMFFCSFLDKHSSVDITCGFSVHSVVLESGYSIDM